MKFVPRRWGYRPVPDHTRYGLPRAHASSTGTPVPYSTDGSSGYAPLRGAAQCVSCTGFPRRMHEFDGDGICFWCDVEIS